MFGMIQGERLVKIDRREIVTDGIADEARGCCRGRRLSGEGVDAGSEPRSMAIWGTHAQANPAAATANAAKDAGAKPISLTPYVDALPRLPVIHPNQQTQWR